MDQSREETKSIQIKDLSVSFGSLKALDRVSFELSPGECLGIIGVNGSGKTTLCNSINNICVNQSGSIKIFGKTHGKVDKNMLGYMMPQCDFFADMTGRDILHFSLASRGFSKKESLQRASNWLDRVGLKKSGDKLYSGYSTGMKSRLKLAVAMAHDPELIFLDEPFMGLDIILQYELSKLISEAKSQGKTIFLISHNYAKIAQHADKIMVLHSGRIVSYESLSYYEQDSLDLNESFYKILKEEGLDVEFSDYC